MSSGNNHNLLYFESNSMKGLFEVMDRWQFETEKRLLSIEIQQDAGKYCCVALTNPSEVIICDGDGRGWKAKVGSTGCVHTA